MGCFSKAPSSTTQTVQPPQAYLDAYKSVLGQAQNVASTPYQAYSGQGVAPLAPGQQQGIDLATGLPGSGQSSIDQAMGLVNGSAAPISGNFGGMTADQLQQYLTQGQSYLGQSVAPITTQAFTPENIAQYQNPYQQQVIDATMAQLNHQNAVQQTGLAGNAISAGAWGGDRAGVAAAELARGQGANMNSTIANLENQGYTQAVGQFNTQNQLSLQEQENQAARAAQAAGTDLSGYFQGTGQNLNAMTADQQRALQAGSTIGTLGNMGFGQNLESLSALLQTGGVQQNQQQALDNYLQQQFTAQQQYPFNTTGWLANIAEGVGSKSGSTTTTTAPAPSGISSAIGGLTAGAGIFNSLFGGSGSGAVGGATTGGGKASGGRISGNVTNIGRIRGAARGGRMGYDGGGSVMDLYVDPWAGPTVPNSANSDSILQPAAPPSNGGKSGGGGGLGGIGNIGNMFSTISDGIGSLFGGSSGAAGVGSGIASAAGGVGDAAAGAAGGIGEAAASAGSWLMDLLPMILALKRGGRVGLADGGGLDGLDAPWDSHDVATTASVLDAMAARKAASQHFADISRGLIKRGQKAQGEGDAANIRRAALQNPKLKPMAGLFDALDKYAGRDDDITRALRQLKTLTGDTTPSDPLAPDYEFDPSQVAAGHVPPGYVAGQPYGVSAVQQTAEPDNSSYRSASGYALGGNIGSLGMTPQGIGGLMARRQMMPARPMPLAPPQAQVPMPMRQPQVMQPMVANGGFQRPAFAFGGSPHMFNIGTMPAPHMMPTNAPRIGQNLHHVRVPGTIGRLAPSMPANYPRFADGGGLDDDTDFMDDGSDGGGGYAPTASAAPASIGDVSTRSSPPPATGKDWYSKLAASPNYALIMAGLNIMAGKSPYALENIGAGAAAGLQAAGQAHELAQRDDYQQQLARARMAAAEARATGVQNTQDYRTARLGQIDHAQTIQQQRADDAAKQQAARDALTTSGQAQEKAHWDAIEKQNADNAKRAELSSAGADVDRLSLAMSNNLYGVDEKTKAQVAKAYSDAVTRYQSLLSASQAAPPAVTTVPNPLKPAPVVAPAAGATPPVVAPPAPVASATPPGQTPRVKSAADYAAVPPGSQYYDPQGKLRTKAAAGASP